ncbi:nuclear autoantigenic sperm protein [Plodia interpunctella]|uniref:nuclear autoantigenic sperm protein n=1 Tax=Plodia interpunctella TaxID=58824 RepID=UPI0023686AE1|nr:nuclear autoantigenic sperm protein [Plodia interpunctella]
MAEVPEVTTSSATELLATGRRHLAVRDYTAAAESLSLACEQLAQEYGEQGDQCAEAYFWYGKALLGLSREESGVLGDAVPGANTEDGDNEEQEDENGETEAEKAEENGDTEKNEPESTTKEDEPGSSTAEAQSSVEPGTTTNGDEGGDEEENQDGEDNLQLAWEMLELARIIFDSRVTKCGDAAARAQLADAHLALGEVALESETYDKAVLDMQRCLEIQKELYRSDDRRIAETHYQIGLANYLASNFEEAITHFKNAANILESRIKTLENPAAASEDVTVKKYSSADPHYSIEGEIKELKDLLPQIQEKIQDMMDYKAETIKRVREALGATNGDGPSLSSSSSSSHSNGAGASSSSSSAKPAADISHLIKRKRKSSENDAESSAPKRINT